MWPFKLSNILKPVEPVKPKKEEPPVVDFATHMQCCKIVSDKCYEWVTYEFGYCEYDSVRSLLKMVLGTSCTGNTRDSLNALIAQIKLNCPNKVFIRLNNLAMQLELMLPRTFIKSIQHTTRELWDKYNDMEDEELDEIFFIAPSLYLIPFLHEAYYRHQASLSANSNTPGKDPQQKKNQPGQLET